MDRSDLTAYILAGGGSRRMGVDKLFLKIDGQFLLERTLATCEAFFGQVKLVSANTDKFALFDCQVVLDSLMAQGPMAGVVAALEDCEANTCFVTAADLFDLNVDVIISLINQYSGQQYFGLIEASGVQPLCGLYHKSALEILYQFAKKDDFSMKAAVGAMNHDGIILPEGLWRNINSPNDLAIGDANA